MSATPPEPPPAGQAADETPWRRLDPRMLVVGPLGGLGRLLPLLVILLVTGGGADPTRMGIAGVAALVVVVAGVIRWRTTRYRITGERVELHSGWLRRQRRSVPRDRIRTVDLTARLLHRASGLSVVSVSAASGSPLESAGLSLDAVSKAEADRLRRELLDRSPTAAGPAQAPAPGQLLARLDWSWLRFAPLTFTALAGIGAVGATLFNLLGDLGLDPRDIGAVDDAARRFNGAPFWMGALVGVLALLVVASVAAVLLYAERWYDYRLTREPDGTLRVKRGLLTRRSLSVSEQRLRGVEITEPLLLRAGRGAQTQALSTGLSREAQGGTLLPPAPRAEAQRVASAALREHPWEITGAPLRRHPPAARTRRLTRAVGPAVVLAAVLAVAAVVEWPVAWLGLLLVPAAVAVGIDRYRNLGHQLTARHLVTRQGSLVRSTVALQRDGVIGWTVRQSPFQRRAGVVTVEAVTAAGQGGYTVLDVAAADGVALADAATPTLLTPFLHREDTRWPAS